VPGGYGKCPKSQHGIHKPEILHYISFLDIGLHTFGSNVGSLTLAHSRCCYKISGGLLSLTLIIIRLCRAYVLWIAGLGAPANIGIAVGISQICCSYQKLFLFLVYKRHFAFLTVIIIYLCPAYIFGLHPSGSC